MEGMLDKSGDVIVLEGRLLRGLPTGVMVLLGMQLWILAAQARKSSGKQSAP
jgi:hypothetical protein